MTAFFASLLHGVLALVGTFEDASPSPTRTSEVSEGLHTSQASDALLPPGSISQIAQFAPAGSVKRFANSTRYVHNGQAKEQRSSPSKNQRVPTLAPSMTQTQVLPSGHGKITNGSLSPGGSANPNSWPWL